jgi:arabinofuranosyltransferase
LICLLTPLAYLCRFVQDDAFISFRYAANLIAGHGLVFNPGERVEGYTNFLWTALMAIPHALGIDPIDFVNLAGLITFPLGLAATYQLAASCFASAPLARIAVLLVGTNYSFAAWATGGLETSFHACLIASSLAWMATATRWGWTPARAVVVSTFIALALLTRLDSLALLGLPAIVALWTILRERRRRSALLIGLLAPLGAIVLPWVFWKVSFYGELLPNTYWVKLGKDTLLRNGIAYLGTFGLTYVLFAIPPVVLLAVRRLSARVGLPTLVVLCTPLLSWSVYLLRAGGDFMEFRLMVPVIPVLMVLAAWLIVELFDSPTLRAACVALLLGASLLHAATFERSPLRRPWIESVPGLARWLVHPEYGWIGLGRYLGTHLAAREGGEPPVRVALTPAGAIPYYSGLESVDMLGLNDRWVARHGTGLGPRAGHRRIATLDYLTRRRVHLVLGHPQSLDELPPPGQAFDRDRVNVLQIVPDPESLPPAAKVVVAPYGAKAGIVMIYLTTHPRIEAVIRGDGWRVYEVEPGLAANLSHPPTRRASP